jgi:hypothetical protein
MTLELKEMAEKAINSRRPSRGTFQLRGPLELFDIYGEVSFSKTLVLTALWLS